MSELAIAISLFTFLALAWSFFLLRRANSEIRNLQSQIDRNQIEENFSRAIFQESPSEESFIRILEEYLAKLFPETDIQAWRFLEQPLWDNHPSFRYSLLEISGWLLSKSGVEFVARGDACPWNAEIFLDNDLFVASLFQEQGETPIAAIAFQARDGADLAPNATALIEFERRVRFCSDLLSAFLVTLARDHQQKDLQQMRQEISIASQIQSDLLPIEYPKMPGWQLAFSLQSAGDLSGDFLDFIPLDENRIGLLIADVAGKGLGAALYMTLCRTLIRTFAKDYFNRPDLVIADCNERLLDDARDALFVTAFYAVLDIKQNILTYTNAGHNPPFLIQTNGKHQALPLTGMPIGIDPEENWTSEEITLDEGDFLVLYTDGLPDASNAKNESFGSERLIDQLRSTAEHPANIILDDLLSKVKAFSAGTPQFDDMTTMIVKREEAQQ